ncbi:MAG: succinate--CoA ligase [Epsilonproteobacteria bacterium]|nr:succinate--CoA ligase [Campylobacterota bacterium]NPA89786.1 succinate--CoA ligase [Campylobacterota bacterium]
MKKRYRVAHSPDADDIFMFAVIKWGWVEVGGGKILLESWEEDIETLNQKAIKGEYDVTAISFGVYPYIWREYALLRGAVSFGYGYGPKLVKRRGERLKKRFKVALSGKYTTNALLFRIAYPNARIVYKNFLEIEKAVLRGEVDAGVLIHESILDINPQLEVEKELWDIWVNLIGEELPLPLGGMGIRRSIPLWSAIAIEEAIQKGVVIANRHRKIVAQMLEKMGKVRVDGAKLEKYLSMYAGKESVELTPEQIAGLNALYKLGAEKGLIPPLKSVENYFIPREYTFLREGREV